MNLHANSKPMVGAVFIGVMVVLMGLMGVGSISIYADETKEVPEEIDINNKIYPTDRKGSVWFSHLEHAEGYADACDECHHDYRNGENVWKEGLPVAKCSKCHDATSSSGGLKKLRIAYHTSCKGCHKKLAAEGGTSAPYKQCTDCHER